MADGNYGSDEHGVVWSYWFSAGQAAREIGSREAIEQLASCREPSSKSFVWLHLAQSHVASEPWLREHLALPDGFYESLHEEAVASRIEQAGDQLVAVLHDVRFDSSFDSPEVSALSLCIDRALVVSVRRRPLRSVDRLRLSVRKGTPCSSPAGLLARLLRDQSDVLAEIVRELRRRVDAAEDDLLANRMRTTRRNLGTLRRVLVRLQRLLAPEPAAFFRLLNRPPSWIDPDDLQDLRVAAEELSTALTDSGALVERIKLLQEEIGARANEATSRTLFILTLVTVLALPINLIAGLFGMNVGGIPFAGDAHGFLRVVVPVLGLTGGLAYLAIRGRRDS